MLSWFTLVKHFFRTPYALIWQKKVGHKRRKSKVKSPSYFASGPQHRYNKMTLSHLANLYSVIFCSLHVSIVLPFLSHINNCMATLSINKQLAFANQCIFIRISKHLVHLISTIKILTATRCMAQPH